LDLVGFAMLYQNTSFYTNLQHGIDFLLYIKCHHFSLQSIRCYNPTGPPRALNVSLYQHIRNNNPIFKKSIAMKKDLINAFLSLMLTATMLGLVVGDEQRRMEASLTDGTETNNADAGQVDYDQVLSEESDGYTSMGERCYLDHDARPWALEGGLPGFKKR
jgi:hypothetical protein